jgi:hypothetical protein
MATIPEDPGTWTIQDVRQAAAEFRPEPAAETNRAFYAGDHWQSGNGWIGPMADPTAQPREAQRIMSEIRRQFTSKNAIREVVDRHRNALVSRQVDVRITPKEQATAAQGTQATEAPAGDLVGELGRRNGAEPGQRLQASGLSSDAQQLQTEPAAVAEEEDQEAAMLRELVREWLEREDIQDAVQEAITGLLLTRRGALRFYVPPTVLDDDSRIRTQEPDRALQNIYLEAPADGRAGVFSHRISRRRVAIFIDPEGTEDGAEYAEIAWHDEETDLVEIVQFEEGQQTARLSVPLPRLPGHEVTEPHAFITEQIRSQQRGLNLAETMMPRNMIVGGFLERTLLNAQVDGGLETLPDGREIYRGPSIQWGAGVTNIFTGVRTRGQNGLDMVAQPELIYKDPVPVETFTQASEHHYLSILQEAHQLHYAIADDATASGTSRVTAMADHITAVLQSKQKVDLALTWIVEAAAGYLELLTNQPGRWSQRYNIKAEARLEFGPIAPAMIQASVMASEAKLLSRKTAMGWIGVEDPEQEQSLIDEEAQTPLANQAQLVGQLGSIEQLLSRGATRNGNNEADNTEPANGNND